MKIPSKEDPKYKFYAFAEEMWKQSTSKTLKRKVHGKGIRVDICLGEIARELGKLIDGKGSSKVPAARIALWAATLYWMEGI